MKNKRLKNILCISLIISILIGISVSGVFFVRYKLKRNIVFLGDSITALCPLNEYYGELNADLYNEGVFGDTTDDVIARLDNVYAKDPDVIVLCIGTNNISHGDTTDKIMKDYRFIIEDVYRHFPKVKIYCVSIPPRHGDYEGFDEMTNQIIEVNHEIDNLSKYLNCTYINTFDSLSDGNNRLVYEYGVDGLHLDAKGFEICSDILLPHLKKRR